MKLAPFVKFREEKFGAVLVRDALREGLHAEPHGRRRRARGHRGRGPPRLVIEAEGRSSTTRPARWRPKPTPSSRS